MRARLLVPFFAASCAALAGIGDGFGLGDNGGFDGPSAAGGGLAGDPSPTFDLVAGATTPNDLPDTLTVNSTSMTLVLACDAQGVSGTTWTCRDANGAVTLSRVVTGNDPFSVFPGPFRSLDTQEQIVTYPATFSPNYHEAPSSSVGDIATEDFAIELIGAGPQTNVTSGTTGANLLGKRETSGSFNGWSTSAATGVARITLTSGGLTTQVSGPSAGCIAGPPSSNQQFCHHIAFVDRSEASTNGAVFYSNGAAGTGVNASAVGSLSVAPNLTIGRERGSIASFRIWKCSGCFAGGATNPAQWAPIARQRTAIAFGVSPIIARGSAIPTTLTRATTAHVDVVDGNTRQLYLVGNGAPRVARRTSQGSPIAGYLSEPAVSNIALQSQTLQTTWAAITAGDNVLTDAYAGADLTTTGDNIDGNNSNAEHGLRQSITVTGGSYTFSVWAKTGTQNFVALRNATIANGTAWFDVATCTSSSCTIGEDCASAVGTVQAGVTRASAERYPVDTTGDGVADVNLCRVAITYTGTAAAHNHDLLCAPSNGTLTYTDADAAADCGFWGVRVEAFPMATSYLATTTASTARNLDDLRFDAASHYIGSPATMDVVTLCPTYSIPANIATFFMVGSSTNDLFQLSANTLNRQLAQGTAGGSTQWSFDGTSTNVANGLRHSARLTMQDNNIVGYFDNVQFGSDTLATLPSPSGLSIRVATSFSAGTQPACLINRARLWSSLVAP